jgi:hypothetical protein
MSDFELVGENTSSETHQCLDNQHYHLKQPNCHLTAGDEVESMGCLLLLLSQGSLQSQLGISARLRIAESTANLKHTQKLG